MFKLLIRSVSAVLLAALLGVLALFAVYYEPDPGDGAPRVVVAVDRTLWNGLGLNRLTYVRALRRAGLSTVLVPYPDDDAGMTRLSDDVAGVVLFLASDSALAYGGDPARTRNVKPSRDAFEFVLFADAEARGLPVLGLCRGAQLINVHRGGTLGDFRDGPEYRVHRNLLQGHAVELEAGSQLAAIYGARRLEDVTTWHGQHVDAPGRGLVVSAFSPDGIPEAIEGTGEAFLVGVQWHAEMPPWRNDQQPLFDAFADAVRGNR